MKLLRPLALLLALSLPVAAQELVLLQTSDGYTTLDSARWQSPAPRDVEAADDFGFVGDVTRVIAHGYKGFASGTLSITGVWVRFYESQGGAPGALQHEVFLPEGAAGFVHTAYPENLDVTLPTPFAATGLHFVSVQLVTPASHQWVWWSAGTQNPSGAPAHVRNNLGSGAWQVHQTSLGFQTGLAFELWGIDDTPPPDPTDPCGAWEELVTPELPANYGTTILRDVVVIANDDVWAVGDPSVEVQFLNYEFKNLAMHWDGDDWTIVPTPNPGVFPDPYQQTGLVAVDAAGPNHVWAIGNWERQDALGFIITQPLVLRWDGNDWEHLIVPNTNFDTHTYATKVFAPDDAWVIGGGGAPLAFHWDGSSFEMVDVPDFGLGAGTPGFEFEATDGVASDDLWAVGGGSDGDYSARTFIAHWDGSSWSYVPAPEPGITRRLFDVHARTSDDVWAVGQYTDLVGGVLRHFAFALRWNGSSWQLFDGQVEPVGSLAVHAFAADDVYAAGGQIYHFDGTSWSVADDLGQLSGDAISVAVAGLDAVEPCHVWAAGRQDVGGALVPFTARQQGPNVWATGPSPCPTGLAGGIALVSGPKLGTPFTVAIGDPDGQSGYTPGATFTLWALSRAALPACGVPLPGYGPGGAPASLLVDLSPGALLGLDGPGVWGGVQSPALHTVLVPNDPSLIDFEVKTQGLLFDPSHPTPRLLTSGFDARLGL